MWCLVWRVSAQRWRSLTRCSACTDIKTVQTVLKVDRCSMNCSATRKKKKNVHTFEDFVLSVAWKSVPWILIVKPLLWRCGPGAPPPHRLAGPGRSLGGRPGAGGGGCRPGARGCRPSTWGEAAPGQGHGYPGGAAGRAFVRRPPAGWQTAAGQWRRMKGQGQYTYMCDTSPWKLKCECASTIILTMC